MTGVLRFPALPPIPLPPGSAPDERQETFIRIAGSLGGGLFRDGGRVIVANTSAGFRASAVDVGVLQDILEGAIAHFEMAQVQERWDEDLFDWMRQVILSWVQRCKAVQMRLEENGVRISIETQDDRGYYRYEFDVFPGRAK